MLQISGLSVAVTIILLIICFILPMAIYYFLYRYVDGKVRMLVTGAIAFFASFIVEITAQNIIYMFTNMRANTPVLFLYTLVISPLLFLLINFVAIRFFGNEMETTGDSIMYSTGYTGLQNMLSIGFTELFNLISILTLGGASSYVIVSDSDYASYSDMVSASNLLSESNYNYLNSLCTRPASYIVAMCIDRLFIIAAYTAILLVIWLAVRKQGGMPLLAAAFGMRALIAIPSLLGDMNIISSVWALLPIALAATVIVWVIAIVCRNKFIDKPNRAYKK